MKREQHQEVQGLVDILNEHNLTEIEIERRGLRIRVRRDRVSTVSFPTAVTTPSGEQSQDSHVTIDLPEVDHAQLVTVTSPLVGTFYRSPSLDADPYVEEHDFVRKGQVLCIVEAMKLMNEIESEADGRLVKILVATASPVEYGQPLFLIDPIPVS